MTGTAASTPLSITTSTVLGRIAQTPYSTALAATGGSTPYSWTVTSGGPTGGLNLNAATGVISGTPTSSGHYSFTALVNDSSTTAQTTTASYTMTLVDPLQVATASLPGGTIQSNYSATLLPSGGMAPYTWSIAAGVLPGGMTLDAPTGVISATMTAAGSYSFTVEVDEPPQIPQKAKRQHAMTVLPAAWKVTQSGLPGGQVESAYSATLAPTGGTTPYSWRARSVQNATQHWRSGRRDGGH